MQRTGTLLTLVCALFVANNAMAAPLQVRGPHDKTVRAGIEHALNALDFAPADNAIDVELQAVTPQVVHYRVRVKRRDGELVRNGLATPDDVKGRVTSIVLLGLMARDAQRRPRAALLVEGDRKPSASVLATWKQTLVQRGLILVADEEVALARSAVKVPSDGDRATELAKLFVVPVVHVQLDVRGHDVAIQVSVVDAGPRRGTFALVTAAHLEAEVAVLLDLAPIFARRAR